MDPALHIALGLTDEEFEEILRVLGRQPNHLELAMYSVMWSEHCSYKSSRIHLRRLPTKGERVLMGPGENAGVIDAGDGFAVAIRMESHNHPSAIEPYQGAATGVGGILRDIFTVGARPVALLDSLWMGPQEDPKNRWIFRGVVSGISGYGNAVGVPTVGGEIDFRGCFGANPLVNVAAIGISPVDRLIRAAASGVGNQVVLLGASTGRDGIGGVSVLASAGFGEGADDSKRPSVQVGDPFEEKKLIEACLDLLDRKLIVGIQDLGGAGLSCATSETASKAGNGMDVYLDAVPLREEDMESFEVMTSESQERMLAIVRPELVEEVLGLAEKWEVNATVIGEVTAAEELFGDQPKGILRIFDRRGGEILAEVPADSLAEDAPLYDREMREPEDFPERRAQTPKFSGSIEALKEYFLLQSFDPALIYRQYDHQLFLNTLIGPGSDAALLQIAAPGVGRSNMAMGLSIDGNPGWCEVDPYLGALATVAESVLNVACVGADPVAIVDCLNFGNPTHPEVMWQLSKAIDGIATACRELSVAVVGGNVSLYNEADGRDIEPNPTITTLGLRPMPTTLPSADNLSQELSVVLLGGHAQSLSGSDLAVKYMDDRGGSLFEIDFELHRSLIAMAISIARGDMAGQVVVHNLGSGGLVQGLMDLALRFGGIEVFEQPLTVESLFGESPSRLLVLSLSPEELLTVARSRGIEAQVIGRTGGGRLGLTGWFEVDLEQYRASARQ